MKADKWFLLSWKRIILILAVFLLSVILHNFVSALFNFEEAFFFILAVFVIPIYFIISVVYSLIKKIRGGANRRTSKHRRRK
tara:strand:+ start:328 stop:573 length:246 start_codon:yes stop_codon:yes gene_type:complete